MGIWHGLPTYMVDFYGKIVGKYIIISWDLSWVFGLDDPILGGISHEGAAGLYGKFEGFPFSVFSGLVS